MDSDVGNIALICFLMGIGIVAFLILIAVFLTVQEFIETWYLED